MLPARRRLSSQPQFTPRQLFAAMKGAWLEPPTGAQLGPELVTNGTFDVDISGVQEVRDVNNIVIPTTNTWESGSLKSARNGADNFGFSIPISVKEGSIYNIKATAIQGTAWRVFVRFSPTKKFTDALYYDYTPTVPFGTRNFSFAAKATTTATWYVIFQCVDITTNGMYHNFDNISVREVLTTATPGIAWQENTGITPVSAPGHPVGLLMDQSQGMVLGPELITNSADRDFSSDTGFWSKATGATTITGGVAHLVNQANGFSIYKNSFLTIGNAYRLVFTIKNFANGGLQIYSGMTIANPIANGTYTCTFVANNTILGFSVASGPVNFDIDDVSIKPILGNHAYQTTAANRPTYQLDANSLPLIRHDTNDVLTVSLPNLGGGVFSNSGSVYFATPQGMSALHDQSMGTSYNLPALSTDVYAWCVTPARLNAAQEARLERYFLRKAGIATPDYITDENGNILTDDLDIPLLAG